MRPGRRMTEPTIDLEAPGLAFSALLQLQKPKRVRAFIPEEMLSILDGLEPGFSTSDKIIGFARDFLEPSAVLSDQTSRVLAIELLPLRKAKELCEKLQVEPGRDAFEAALSVANDPNLLPTILAFFGVVDEARAPVPQLPGMDTAVANYALFAHQRLAAARTRTMLDGPPHRGVLHMPTGAGKTRTGMHLVCGHLLQKEPTLVVWLAHNVELLDQAADEFAKAWGHLGNREVQLIRFWGTKKADLSKVHDGFVVAGLSKMTALDKRSPNDVLRLADRASLIVIDEAHQATAPTYRAVLDALATKRPSTQLLGLTATPGRTWADIPADEALAKFFNEQKVMLDVEGHEDPVSYLMAEGYLAKPNFRTLNVSSGLDLSDEDRRRLSNVIDVSEAFLERLGQSTQRNLSIVAMCDELVSRHKRIIVFAPSVANAKVLASIMIARGVEGLVVTGDMPASIRERTIRRFKSSIDQPIIMFNFGVLTTGFDAPRTSAAIIARPTKSLVLYSQMVGRATRGVRAGGNKEAEIVTVTDTELAGFGDVSDAFVNWEDVWHGPTD